MKVRFKFLFRTLAGRRSTGNERGQSTVEFALVLPILMMVMTGALSFGIAMHNSLILANGVNAGAQLLSISRGQTLDPCATAYGAIQSAGPGLGSGLSVTFVIDGVTYANTNTCTAAATNMVQGATAQVKASYPCSLALYGMPVHSCNLATQVTEYIQ